MKEMENNGGRPVNRLKGYEKRERRKEKHKKTETWYMNDIMFYSVVRSIHTKKYTS